jgi:hypothetical protein
VQRDHLHAGARSRRLLEGLDLHQGERNNPVDSKGGRRGHLSGSSAASTTTRPCGPSKHTAGGRCRPSATPTARSPCRTPWRSSSARSRRPTCGGLRDPHGRAGSAPRVGAAGSHESPPTETYLETLAERLRGFNPPPPSPGRRPTDGFGPPVTPGVTPTGSRSLSCSSTTVTPQSPSQVSRSISAAVSVRPYWRDHVPAVRLAPGLADARPKASPGGQDPQSGSRRS